MPIKWSVKDRINSDNTCSYRSMEQRKEDKLRNFNNCKSCEINNYKCYIRTDCSSKEYILELSINTGKNAAIPIRNHPPPVKEQTNLKVRFSDVSD